MTPSARRPRLLRCARGTASAPPIVVGKGGDQGVPYAVGRDVVLLKESGARAFTTRTPGPVVSPAENAYGIFVADFDRLGLVWTSGGKLCWSEAVGVTPAPPGGRGC